MRVLILGGTGMLGHKVWQKFDERFDTLATIRDPNEAWQNLPFWICDAERYGAWPKYHFHSQRCQSVAHLYPEP